LTNYCSATTIDIGLLYYELCSPRCLEMGAINLALP
jgi:hypothetical protein